MKEMISNSLLKNNANYFHRYNYYFVKDLFKCMATRCMNLLFYKIKLETYANNLVYANNENGCYIVFSFSSISLY